MDLPNPGDGNRKHPPRLFPRQEAPTAFLKSVAFVLDVPVPSCSRNQSGISSFDSPGGMVHSSTPSPVVSTKNSRILLYARLLQVSLHSDGFFFYLLQELFYVWAFLNNMAFCLSFCLKCRSTSCFRHPGVKRRSFSGRTRPPAPEHE